MTQDCFHGQKTPQEEEHLALNIKESGSYGGPPLHRDEARVFTEDATL